MRRQTSEVFSQTKNSNPYKYKRKSRSQNQVIFAGLRDHSLEVWTD